MTPRIVGIAFLLTLVSTSAFAQWTWLNPKPQGHTLNDVEFLDDNTAIAVGDVGTILITHDAGLTWSWKSKVEGVTGSLVSVARVDDFTAICAGAGGVILRTTDAGATWNLVPSGTGTLLEDVDYEAGLAVAVGHGVIRRSTDAGASWTNVVVDGGMELHDVDVVTASVVVAAADFFYFRSEDGGNMFAPTFISMRPTAIAFTDEMNGVVAWNGRYDFTTDGGLTWDERSGPDFGSHHSTDPSEIELDGIETLFVAATAGGCDGMMNCFSAGHLFLSNNGADTWDSEYSARRLFGLSRNDSGVIICVGEAGSIYRWSDPNWQLVGGSPYDHLDTSAGVTFQSPSVGIVAATQQPISIGNVQTTFLRTSDGGASWTSKSLFGTYITDVEYTPGMTPPAYAVGRQQLNGIVSTVLLKSVDGGATWPTLWSSPSAPSLNAIEFQSASHGVAVGQAGSFVMVDNDVATTGSITNGGNLFDVAFADGSVVVAVGGTSGNPPSTSSIARSIDGGTTWNLAPHATGAPLYGIDFASASVGVAVGAAGRMIRTEDGGATWNPVAAPTAQHLLSVSFSTALNGFAVGNSGIVLETNDGGLSWTSLATPTTVGFRDVVSFSQTHAVLVSWDLIVLEYKQTPLPTLISSFAGEARPFAVNLSWAVREEANLSEFRIERSDATTGRTFHHIAGTSRSFRDDSVAPGSTYEYTLVAVDNDGAEAYSAPIRVTTSPAELTLLPNVPNPFNPSTTIRYVLPTRERVRVTIYDVSGRPVATIVDREEAAGNYGVAWNGTDDAGSRVASGVYMVRIEAGKQSLSRKMVLLK